MKSLCLRHFQKEDTPAQGAEIRNGQSSLSFLSKNPLSTFKELIMDFIFILLLIRSLLFFSFFLLAVVWDFRKRLLPKYLLLCFLILGIPFYVFTLWEDFFQNGFTPCLSFLYSFYPFVISFFMLFFSKLSKGALGTGDAFFLLCSSLYMDYMSFFFFFLSGLLCSALISIFLSLYFGAKSKNLKNISFPFIPCFIPGGLYFFFILFFRII